MLNTWLKSGSSLAVQWLMWVLVMQRAQWTGGKRLTFFNFQYPGNCHLSKVYPYAPVNVRHKRWPSQTLITAVNRKLSESWKRSVQKPLFPSPFSSKALFCFFNSAGLGVWFMELREKMSWGGNAKGSRTVAPALWNAWLGCTRLSSSFLNHCRHVLCMHQGKKDKR